MSDPFDSWDKVRAFALSLPDTEAKTGRMASVEVTANGRYFVFTGREPDTSFAIAIDLDTVEMLKETEPETFWQSPHYEGWPAVLVRYDSRDPERVSRVIEQAYQQAAARKPARKRKK